MEVLFFSGQIGAAIGGRESQAARAADSYAEVDCSLPELLLVKII